jgi:short-subunit dehydrogenase
MSIHTENKGVALVTGASAGLGRVYADRLAKQGYDLILVARRGDRLKEITESLQAKYGIKARSLVADLSNPNDLRNLVDVLSTDTTITMLVNNAGIATLAPVMTTEKADADAMNDINVTALIELCYAALPKFKARNSGTIINVGSVLSFHTLPISSVYSGTKGYVMNFTRGLQSEVEGTNVFVQLVLPASTATELWDLSGVPLKNLNQSTLMSADDCVDAALAGLAQKELITLPSLESKALWEAYDEARQRLFAGTQSGQPASRYQLAFKK